MKTWLTYLAAAAMGLAFELNLRDTVLYVSTVNFMADVVLKLGMFMVFPLAFFTMSSGTASLTRKRGQSSFIWISTIFWSIFTSVALSICAALLFRLFPAAFPVTSTTPQNAEQAAVVYNSLASSTAAKLVAANPLSINAFVNFIKSSDCLLPIILLSLVFGYAIRPTSEVVRPAYITLNSISEVMFRLARQVSKFLWIGVFFLSATWFNTLWTDGTIFKSWRFVVLCCIVGLSVLLVLLPLFYAIVTGFRRNPYRQILRLFSAGVAAFFSVNYMFSMPTIYTNCRTNMGIQKSVVSVSLPLHSVLTKGGSALVSTMCTCSLVYAINGVAPTALQGITIAFACTVMSFISSIHAGYEVAATTSFAIGLLGVSISGAEFALLGILPLLNGMAIMLDVMLAGLGTSFAACHLKADCHIRPRDTV